MTRLIKSELNEKLKSIGNHYFKTFLKPFLPTRRYVFFFSCLQGVPSYNCKEFCSAFTNKCYRAKTWKTCAAGKKERYE